MASDFVRVAVNKSLAGIAVNYTAIVGVFFEESVWNEVSVANSKAVAELSCA